jgi:Fibronectin type III domain
LSCTGTGGSASQSATVTVTPATGTATLTWVPPTKNTDGTPVTPLSGYTLYYGTSASSLTQSAVVSGSTTTSYTITGLASGTWYFAVAADAKDGTQSPKSNVGSKTI